MKKYNIIFFMFFIATLFLSSCVQDLDVEPIDPNISTANNVLKTIEDYKMALAKIYGGYAVSGQEPVDANVDIRGIDGGTGNYLRQLWSSQELSTDEAITGWADEGIREWHYQNWTANNIMIFGLYSRIFYTIGIANEFIRNTEGKTGEYEMMQAEARFLRAFSYYHAIDLFGNVPFITEEDKPGAYFPPQIKRKDLFDYIEKELKDIETKLGEPRFEYGRADKAAAWMLLAKLYLNSEVYTGTPRYNDAITYLNKVISAGYFIDSNYKRLFSADNNESPEMIFPICFDGINTQTWGGVTMIINGSKGDGIPEYGTVQSWGGHRATHSFVENCFGLLETDFDADNEYKNIPDKRGMFFFDKAGYGWEWEIPVLTTRFNQGVGVTKFRNINSDGSEAVNHHDIYVSTDFPVFRLADAYLMYAEAVLRGGNGSRATALQYVNKLRQRAYGDQSGNITDAELTLDFILNERGRELYWEGHRRTDLIRFGKFTESDYLWEWKGNAKDGRTTEAFRNLYPIPANDLNANPNLVQNPGY